MGLSFAYGPAIDRRQSISLIRAARFAHAAHAAGCKDLLGSQTSPRRGWQGRDISAQGALGPEQGQTGKTFAGQET
jgi:hypothetical protein